MKCFAVFACLVHLALSLPQGYNYNDAGPVDLNLGGFKPVVGPGTPCNHGPNLVQQQSTGRVINHGSGHHGESQAVTVNSHITVGEGGHSHSQVFREGQGYVEQGRPAPISLQQGPPLPLPAPSFLQNSFGSSGSFSHGGGSSGSYSQGGGHGGSVINGIGRVPGPSSHGLSGGYSNGGFGGSKFSGGSGFGGGGQQFSSGAQINPNFIAGGSGLGHSSGGHFHGSGSNYQNVGGFSGGSQFQSGFSSQQQSGGFSHGGGSQSFGNFGGNSVLNGALGNVIRETFANAPLDPTIEKHIYVHVPPEDLEEKESHQQFRNPEAPAKKHYKIIFIKAPTVSQSTNYAQIANAAGQSEEKTIVYVLVKKPEEPSYNEIQQLQQSIKPSKPEVYFIKYKTRTEQQGGGGGGFIGGSYNSNIDQSSVGHQHIETIGGGPFAGSDIDGGVDIRGSSAGSSIESAHHEGGAILSSGSSSSSSSSFSTGSGSVNIGETGNQHEVYGVPSVPSV